jgi:hypothetical protein
VAVFGGHPEGQAIESLLAKSPSLTELFRTIAAKATAHQREQEFADFQKNAQGGTERFPLLFSNDATPTFQMTLDGQSASGAFR